MSAPTLEQAVADGQGIERPFRCHMHEDTNASASVNVLKGVWYCYACHANGTVDGKKAPSAAALASMLEPESAVRIYPESWLELFGSPEYWLTRFTAQTCEAYGLGQDPLTGDATFPVRTPEGHLAGVGRRLANPENPKDRYRYPPRWSAAATCFKAHATTVRTDPIVLVEGAADACAVGEIGFTAWACYGSGLHRPQLLELVRAAPRVVLVGFDADPAGDRGASQTAEMLDQHHLRWTRVAWGAGNDPAMLNVMERQQALNRAHSEATTHG